MTSVWAKEALTGDGWRKGVLVTIEHGLIAQIDADMPPTDIQVGALLPAPANLHSHGFQRGMAGLAERRGPDAADTFWTWRETMYRFVDRLTPDDIEAITAYAYLQMLEAGFAAVAEFHYLHHGPDGLRYADIGETSARIAAAASAAGIGLTLLPVFYERGGCDGRALTARQRRFGSNFEDYARLTARAEDIVRPLPEDIGVGLAPHSLRAVSAQALSAIAKLAGTRPVHMHIAEQPAEVDEVLAAYGARPVGWLLDTVDIGPHWCLVHATHMTADETERLARTGAVAGLCPVTEANLGDGTFRGDPYLSAGGRFGVGTDSNIQIGLAQELRQLEYSQRLVLGRRAVFADETRSAGRLLLEEAARGGAGALGRRSGAIAVGQWADLVALDLGAEAFAGRSGDALLDTFVFAGADRHITDVWSAGRHMVRGGRHIRRDDIAGAYRKAISSLEGRL